MSSLGAAVLVLQIALGTWIVLHVGRWILSRLVWFTLLGWMALRRSCQSPAQVEGKPDWRVAANDLYEKVPFVFK